MIPGWTKALFLAGLVLFAAVDLGSPLVVRVQLDATAAEATAAGGRQWLRSLDAKAAEAAAREEAEADGASLERFEIMSDGRVVVGLTKQAEARAFDRVEQLDTWYQVNVEATSTGSTL